MTAAALQSPDRFPPGLAIASILAAYLAAYLSLT